LVLELSDYCIQDIAQTVRSTLEPLATDKKLAFKLELARELPPGHGDGRNRDWFFWRPVRKRRLLSGKTEHRCLSFCARPALHGVCRLSTR
jgi:hypothetical protein